jgi:flagellar basal-body rod protein FlgF
MDNTTTIALSRLIVEQRAMDVSAENMANINTAGYKLERVLFSDWLSRQTGTERIPGENTFAYVQDRATYRDQRDGTLSMSGNPLDLAISGDGYFTVLTNNGPRLTRAGRFEPQQNGTIVDHDGNRLLDTNGQPIQISPTDTELSIAGDGTISSANGQIGKIGIVKPNDLAKMQAEGSRLFTAGGPTVPVTNPKIIQGAVEDSNVQPVLELTRMMNELREFQFTTQFLQGESDLTSAAIQKLLQRNGS